MADYIYLLQNRLTPAQWRAVEAVREAARIQGMPVFLVGGAVRDLTSGSPVRDLDFAVQGDPAALLSAIEGGGATVTGKGALGSVFLSFRGGVRAELGPTLSVSFPRPGQPEAQPAAILDDLRRRDFTANAMAISLNEGSYGLLLDPTNGTADLENRELRLLSAYGFIEQPALLLRAARLSERLGWQMEERTQSRYEISKEEGHIGALPAADRNYELEELFHEEDPVGILEHMIAEGWQAVLFPELRPADADRAGLDAVRELGSQLEGLGLHPDPSAINFPLVTAKLKNESREALKAMMARPGFVQQIDALEAQGKELAAQLTSKQAAQPSATWHLLMDSSPEVVLWLAFHSRSSAVQGKLKAFMKEWPQMRQRIPYGLMQEMRITPEMPGYDQLLDDLFFALIDGKLDTPEATRAFLEPYSPPAPPQVNVRRRPAKAARSRSKKGAAASAEPAEAPDELQETDADHEEEEGARPEPPPVEKVPEMAATPESAAPEAPGTAGQDRPAPASSSKDTHVAGAKASPPAKTASKAAPAPPPPAKAGKMPAAVEAKPKPAAKAPPAPTPPAKKPTDVTTPATAKKDAPKLPAKATAPVKSAAPAKKVAAKTIATKLPAKKLAAKGPTPAAPQKLAAKQVSAPAAKKVAAKAAEKVASKAGKKAPVKGRK